MEGPDGVRGQLHDVQQGDVHKTVDLSASVWPILVTFDLAGTVGHIETSVTDTVSQQL